MRPQVGQVISNKYRLIRVIGDGGMGSVYEARHELLGTTVALKFLHPELSRRQGLVQRFLQEARVSAQIQSPHVVRVIDVDQTAQNQAFIVMEYLQGRTLQTLYEDLYRDGQRLSYADALEYAMQMLEGVEAAHRAGVVHRDLKPDNVMITMTPKGEPLLKLLDFGIAKLKVTGELERGLTRPGVIMGTPEYMAPEQAYSADKVDARADIFSLGVMIFEMLAGRRPVGGDEPHQIASAYLSGQIARLTDLAPNVAPELAAAVHRAIGAMPADRFDSVAAMREAIEPFARAARVPSALTPAPTGVSAAQTPMPGPITPQGAASGATPAGAATPAEASGAGSDAGAVPKTIPPEDQLPPVGGALPATTEASPLPRPGPATPLGGFAMDMGAAPAGVEARASSPAPIPPHQQGEVEGGGFPATVSAAPYAPPNGSPGGTVSAPPLESPQRPGGTAVGAAPVFLDGGPGAGAATAYAPPQDHRYSAAQGLPGTAPMDPLQQSGPTAQRRPKSSGPPLLLILLSAAGIAGAVVGGVYLADKLSRDDEGQAEGGIAPTPSATLTAAPPPEPSTDQSPPPEPTPPQTTTPPRPTAKPPANPTTTSPKPTATSPQPTSTSPQPTSTSPQPTSTSPHPTTTTSSPPVIVIPSSIPTVLPPGGWPLPTLNIPGQQPPPASTPTSTSTSSTPGRRPIKWRIPGAGN